MAKKKPEKGKIEIVMKVRNKDGQALADKNYEGSGDEISDFWHRNKIPTRKKIKK